MRKLWPGLLALSASAVFSLLMYARLPEQVISHWGADGTPNGWTSRFTFVAGIHALGLLVAVVVAYAPRVDPRRYNFESHQAAYWLVTNAVLVLLAGVTALAVAINAGWNVQIAWTGYGLGLLFIVMGNVFTRVRPNWIFGVRTPWTLSSDRAWRAAHRVAGYGFVIVGVVVVMITALRPDDLMYVLLPGVLIVSLASILRSYFVWKKDEATAAFTK